MCSDSNYLFIISRVYDMSRHLIHSHVRGPSQPLSMEAVSSSETFKNFHYATRHHVPQDILNEVIMLEHFTGA